MFHFTPKHIQAHICICFVAYKVYKELERILKTTQINLSVNKVLDIAQTITTLKIKLPNSNKTITKIMLLTPKYKTISILFDKNYLAEKYDSLLVREFRESFVLFENMHIQQMMESLHFPNIKLKTFKANNDIELYSLLKEDDSPMLFFRFKETDCDACIQSATELLESMSSHFPHGVINILSGYRNTRQFNA